MKIVCIASFLVSPGKNEQSPQEVQGALVSLSGHLYNMLLDVFLRADKECDIPIRFVMADDGSQNNEARSTLLTFIENPNVNGGRILANRLRDCTTKTSGLGLLFLVLGRDAKTYKIVLSRFPADQGILAETHDGTLQLEFIERIFMKSERFYKAALYQGASLGVDFWAGFAVDKQVNAPNYQLAHYWVRDFLASDFKTTPKAGTKRLAVALRQASRTTLDIAGKQEIVAVSRLAQGLAGQVVSIQGLMDRFGLSRAARSAIVTQLPHEQLVHESFRLDQDEFLRHAAYASVELSNEGMLVAPSDRFDDCFQRRLIDEDTLEYHFTTQGRIVDERVRGRR